MNPVDKDHFKNLKEMPKSNEAFELGWKLNRSQLDKIKMGHSAADMDEKWNIYFDQGKLHMHRSWTGSCIYIADILEQEDGTGIITEVVVNRDKNEYNSSSIEDDRNLIQSIIQFQLLDYEPRVKKIDIHDPRFAGIREVIPKEYREGNFSYYQESIENLRLCWYGYPESQYIDMNLTSGIELTIQNLKATKLEFSNVITSIQRNRMLFVISDESFSSCLGVIEFLENPPMK